jgi:isopenicillin N synthase-like dioxygenase
MAPTVSAFALPIISFTSPTAIDDIRDACRIHGFFQLVDHPITEEMQYRTLSAMKSFFSLPTDVKMALKRTDDNAGYEAMQAQHLEPGTNPDMKEGYYCGEEGHVFTGTKFGSNQWPEDPQYREIFRAYYHAVYELSKQVFSMLAQTLSLPPDFFQEFLKEEVSLARTTVPSLSSYPTNKRISRCWRPHRFRCDDIIMAGLGWRTSDSLPQDGELD